MLRKIEEFLRTYVIPLGATALVILFWSEYQCQGYWWWLALIAIILAAHYVVYFRNRKKVLVAEK